ncbi:MAG: hypothetical protein HKN12_07125, partial [Gemmatimonadetes bacterium]|nr:hypothetical protein [Gemmatimonadota bacterium]
MPTVESGIKKTTPTTGSPGGPMTSTTRIYALILTLASIPLPGGPAGAAEPVSDTPRQAAFFIVQREDLDGQRGIDLKDFSILVCNSGLRPDRVAAAARDDALIFSSINVHQIPQWGAHVPIFNHLRVTLGEDRFYWLDSDGRRASIYPNTEELRTTPEIARRYATWAAENLALWDGIFVDELWGERPDWALE